MTWHGRDAAEWMAALARDGDMAAGATPSGGGEREARRVERLRAAVETGGGGSRPMLRWGAGVAAVAVAAALVLSITTALWNEGPTPAATVLAVDGTLTQERDGREVALGTGDVLPLGARLSAHGGSSTVSFVRDARVTLSSETAIRLGNADTEEGVRLDQGRIELSIPRQAPGHVWTVKTASAVVTVVGTRFSVWLTDDEGAGVTCVVVHEGRVHARSSASEATLAAGQQWSSAPASRACGEAIEVEPAPAASAVKPKPVVKDDSGPPAGTTAVTTASGAPERPSPLAPTATASASSSLARENALFAAIVKARRDGDATRTRELGRAFLRKYPSSPLAPQVRAEIRSADGR